MTRPLALTIALFSLLSILTPSTTHAQLQLTRAEAEAIGKRIWKNECAGTIEGLTSWNAGEDFPSLGIGHFIWYPVGKKFRFEDSFPKLLAYIAQRGGDHLIPPWLREAKGSPWSSRSQFLADKTSAKMTSLREFLIRTIPYQVEFMANRAEQSLPRILAALPPTQHASIRQKYYAVASTSNGIYALMDYVNFKGEGRKPSEGYQGVGWGLTQVLQEMRPVPNTGPAAAQEFSRAAMRVLERRIRLAPRDESRWRAGWMKRCASYAEPFTY